jgi:hypothetical protein
VTGRWISLGTSTNKTDRHDIHVAEILLKVALSTINQTSGTLEDNKMVISSRKSKKDRQ